MKAPRFRYVGPLAGLAAAVRHHAPALLALTQCPAPSRQLSGLSHPALSRSLPTPCWLAGGDARVTPLTAYSLWP